MTSQHWRNERQSREDVIRMIGLGEVVATFIVDRGHRNGAERHEITSTGIIVIYNNRTNKMVTKLIARPGQIRRYYENGIAPRQLIEKAIENTRHGYNNA